MDWTKSTMLITGGASGIGLALAQRFAAHGAKVIVCGRRAEALREAQAQCPALVTMTADVSTAQGREALATKVMAEHPELNVLVNNAGIQNRPLPMHLPQDWAQHAAEIETNLCAPMHLSSLLLPHLLSRPEGAVLNVSSGLAFVPLAFMPTYCATKAALHSFTLSLRHQLRETTVRVIEVVPPAVQTDLGGKGLHTQGVALDLYADDAFAKILAGETELGFGFSEKGRNASRAELDAIFVAMNSR
ncbi:MAG: SDR family NAD(P)-dependent oxidoreductase [Deltaproteobacteria bacterium]|nr:SDR family NAD(P)-dependent oxidoreductase [Deltaproteobacteria bacterium]